MTIELTDLDPLPASLATQAYTLVAVKGPAGPVRYKALLTSAAGASPPGTSSPARVTFDQDGTTSRTITFDQA